MLVSREGLVTSLVARERKALEMQAPHYDKDDAEDIFVFIGKMVSEWGYQNTATGMIIHWNHDS